MIIFNHIAWIALNVAIAYHHSRLIKQNRRIYHGWWAAGIGAVIALWGLLNIWYVPVMFLVRLIIFSPVLAKFRGLPWSYSSLTSTSIIDKWERKLFGTWSEKMQVYAGLLFIAEVLLLLFK